MNYRLLDDAVEFYSNHGFQYIEVPWWVPESIMSITRPPGKTREDDYHISVNDKYLIASGEQSLVYLAIKEQLGPGKYQTITPCFRNESIGPLHRKHFMKNELIIIGYHNNISQTALIFFETLFPKDKIRKRNVPISTSIANIDIEIFADGEWIELGSYGWRRTGTTIWTYGTGCAEPRTSTLSKLVHNDVYFN